MRNPHLPLQVLCAPIPSPSIRPITTGDSLEIHSQGIRWPCRTRACLGWEDVLTWRDFPAPRSKGARPECCVRLGSFTADNKWLEMSAGVFMHAKRLAGRLENYQLVARCSSPARGGSLCQLPEGRCCWMQGKGGEGAQWEKAELLLVCRVCRGGDPHAHASPVCARSKAGRPQRHPGMFKALLRGTVSVAHGKGDKSHLSLHGGHLSLAKKRLSPGVMRPPLFSQSPILGRKTSIKPKQEMLYWFWVGRKSYSALFTSPHCCQAESIPHPSRCSCRPLVPVLFFLPSLRVISLWRCGLCCISTLSLFNVCVSAQFAVLSVVRLCVQEPRNIHQLFPHQPASLQFELLGSPVWGCVIPVWPPNSPFWGLQRAAQLWSIRPSQPSHATWTSTVPTTQRPARWDGSTDPQTGFHGSQFSTVSSVSMAIRLLPPHPGWWGIAQGFPQQLPPA